MKDFSALYSAARSAGLSAGNAVAVTPMVVVERNGYTYPPVEGGACGFAWIHFKGNTAWGRWAKKMGHASADYPKGLMIWVGDFNQSMTRKEAYARAFAAVLREAGIDAHARSRMD